MPRAEGAARAALTAAALAATIVLSGPPVWGQEAAPPSPPGSGVYVGDPYVGDPYVDGNGPGSIYAGAVVPGAGGPLVAQAGSASISVGGPATTTGAAGGDEIAAGRVVSQTDILTLGGMGLIAVTAFAVVGARRRFR